MQFSPLWVNWSQVDEFRLTLIWLEFWCGIRVGWSLNESVALETNTDLWMGLMEHPNSFHTPLLLNKSPLRAVQE